MWFKNGQELKGKDNINILDKISNLMIDPVVKQSAGNYTCTVSNAFGRNSFSSILKVRGKSIKFLLHRVIFKQFEFKKIECNNKNYNICFKLFFKIKFCCDFIIFHKVNSCK